MFVDDDFGTSSVPQSIDVENTPIDKLASLEDKELDGIISGLDENEGSSPQEKQEEPVAEQPQEIDTINEIDEDFYVSSTGKKVSKNRFEEIFSNRMSKERAEYEAKVQNLQSELAIANTLTADFEGQTMQEKYVNKLAFDNETTPEAVRQQMNQQELKNTEYMQSVLEADPRIKEHREMKASMMAQGDYTALKAAIPDLKGDNLDSLLLALPQDSRVKFLKMRHELGIDPVTAYRAVSIEGFVNAKPLPASIGTVNTNTTDDDDVFSADEMDKISLDRLAKDEKLSKKYDRSLRRLFKN